MAFFIEHKYLSGWSWWPNNRGFFRTYETKQEAENTIQDFLKHAGPGYTREEKRIVEIKSNSLIERIEI